jgi:hypothetical protein
MAADARQVLIELHYLPSIAYMSLFVNYAGVQLEAHENYMKQSYRNRCFILGPHQVEQLTVPVIGGTRKQPIQEIAIDYRQPWIEQHQRALQTCYGNTPFFEHYFPYFRQVYEQRPARLWELNHRLLTLCLKLLGLPTTLSESSTYKKITNPELLDLRSALRGKQPDEAASWYTTKAYNQIFGKGFVANLSVVDLLFCEGPAARPFLHESARPDA